MSEPQLTSEQLLEIKVGLSALSASLHAFGNAMQQTADALRSAAPMLSEEAESVHRQEWWKRGESPPSLFGDSESMEWWQRGDDPPSFDCAA